MSFKLVAFICLFLISFSTAQIIQDAPNEKTFILSEIFDFTASLKELQEQLKQKAVEERTIVASKIDEWTNDIKQLIESINSEVDKIKSLSGKIVNEHLVMKPTTDDDYKTRFQNAANDLKAIMETSLNISVIVSKNLFNKIGALLN